jgi:hypothetical protein
MNLSLIAKKKRKETKGALVVASWPPFRLLASFDYCLK